MKSIAKICALSMVVTLLTGCPVPKEGDGGEEKEAVAAGEKVSLDFHIMSKCPYGVKVVQAIAPVMEKMSERIELNIHYIGKIKNGEITAMHGQSELNGNIVQLCADELGDDDQWFTFLNCHFKDWKKIPEGWDACAKEAKIDVAKMKACYEGEQGKQLLKASVELSNEKRATSSPSIFLAGERYRGNRSPEAFARAICSNMKEPKAKYCAEIPVPTKIAVTVVGDKRCKEKECDTTRFLAFIKQTFEGAEIKELDYSDAEGKALLEKSDKKYLPIAVFGPEVEKEEAGYARLKRRLTKIKGSEDMVYLLGRRWDPMAEVCDDNVDNTGNGKVDCDDESCQGKKVCRKEIKNKLDVFVMSQCPYGVTTVDAMAEVLNNFKNDRKKMDFEINYVGQDKNGKYTSMHGKAEVDENIRQLCAQKHYSRNYKFMEYVLCRNKDYRSPDWEACAKGAIAPAVIKKCAEGEEGQALWAASVNKSLDLGITGSPKWLVNNRYDMRGRDPNSIKNAFCKNNEGLAGCENTLTAGKQKKAPSGSCGGGAPAGRQKARPKPTKQ